MTGDSASPYTHSHIVLEDGTVTFKCSTDKKRWPWLELHPFDPIVIQTINYWTSVETGEARGTFDTGKWSALTQMCWICGDPSVGHATHGVADAISEDGAPRYRLTFFDEAGSFVAQMSGTGVVFKTRDFEAWREKTKKKIVAPAAGREFLYVAPDKVGMGSQVETYLSTLIDGKTRSAQALITTENGLPPGHPYHSGSGDHVNSTHLADAARQFVCLLFGGEKILCTSGDMNFNRYVELGRPFDIILDGEDRVGNSVSLTVKQAGKSCATMTIGYSRI